jgi:hypothetical protein
LISKVEECTFDFLKDKFYDFGDLEIITNIETQTSVVNIKGNKLICTIVNPAINYVSQTITGYAKGTFNSVKFFDDVLINFKKKDNRYIDSNFQVLFNDSAYVLKSKQFFKKIVSIRDSQKHSNFPSLILNFKKTLIKKITIYDKPSDSLVEIILPNFLSFDEFGYSKIDFSYDSMDYTYELLIDLNSGEIKKSKLNDISKIDIIYLDIDLFFIYNKNSIPGRIEKINMDLGFLNDLSTDICLVQSMGDNFYDHSNYVNILLKLDQFSKLADNKYQLILNVFNIFNFSDSDLLDNKILWNFYLIDRVFSFNTDTSIYLDKSYLEPNELRFVFDEQVYIKYIEKTKTIILNLTKRVN